MSFEIGTEISSQISFKILTGMLLGPLDFVAEKNLFNDFIRANWLEKNKVRVTVFQEIREVIIRKWDGSCLLYTSDAADDLLCVDLGGRRII